MVLIIKAMMITMMIILLTVIVGGFINLTVIIRWCASMEVDHEEGDRRDHRPKIAKSLRHDRNPKSSEMAWRTATIRTADAVWFTLASLLQDLPQLLQTFRFKAFESRAKLSRHAEGIHG